MERAVVLAQLPQLAKPAVEIVLRNWCPSTHVLGSSLHNVGFGWSNIHEFHGSSGEFCNNFFGPSV